MDGQTDGWRGRLSFERGMERMAETMTQPSWVRRMSGCWLVGKKDGFHLGEVGPEGWGVWIARIFGEQSQLNKWFSNHITWLMPFRWVPWTSVIMLMESFLKTRRANSWSSSRNYPFLAYLLLFLIRAIRVIITDSTNVLITLWMYPSFCLCERLNYVHLFNVLSHRRCQTFINGPVQLPRLQLAANVCNV